MTWITENEKTYWMPEVLPEPTDEYQNEQSEKLYLTLENKERRHPGWTYAETNAYVDDEYLFQNEGWKVIVGEKPLEPVSFPRIHYVKNNVDQWNQIDEKTVSPTYTLNGWIPEILPEPTDEYQITQSQKKYLTPQGEEKNHPQWSYAETNAYVDDEYLFQNEGWKVIVDEYPSVVLKNAIRNSSDNWEEIDERNVKVTYSFVDFSPEEVLDYENNRWELLRDRRDSLLQKTDWIIVRASEENLTVTSEVTYYRQQLRDFPETISDIINFDISADSLWPTKPEVYFEV